MAGATAFVLLVFGLYATLAAAELGTRKLLQSTDPNGGALVTVSQDKPRVDAIAITPALPYPQTGIYCNVSGDPRIQGPGAFFPLTVRVPVGVQAVVVFANVTGVIPGSGSGNGTGGGCSSVVQQPGTSVVQQPGTSVVQQPGTSVVQQPGTSVVQQPNTTVVQQPGTSTPGVVQPGTTTNCTTSVLQQPTTIVQQQQSPPSTVVQQPNTTPPASVVQQPNTTPPASVVQQPNTTPPASVVQQPNTTPPASVVQQPGRNPPSSVVQQPGRSPPSSVVQQPAIPAATGVVQQRGRLLLQTPAPVEFISNNGSMGQPQLSVQDTTEGVPSVSFTPTLPGQTATFTGALQVAKTTTNDGFGTPYIPYQVDSKLSPNCGVTVKFQAI